MESWNSRCLTMSPKNTKHKISSQTNKIKERNQNRGGLMSETNIQYWGFCCFFFLVVSVYQTIRIVVAFESSGDRAWSSTMAIGVKVSHELFAPTGGHRGQSHTLTKAAPQSACLLVFIHPGPISVWPRSRHVCQRWMAGRWTPSSCTQGSRPRRNV